MALNSLFCADVPLSNYSLTHSSRWQRLSVSETSRHTELYYRLVLCLYRA